MTKAFAYLRVSGRGQVDGDWFTRQLEAIKKYAAAQNIKIVRVYREEGISGATDWENRPAFSSMMADLLANGTRAVLVERLDRCARDLMVQESIIADFKRKGLSIVSVNEPDLCSDDPSRILMRQMLGAFFQYEKTLLVAKLKGARTRMRIATGSCEGRKAYGHRAGEAAVIERILSLRTPEMPSTPLQRFSMAKVSSPGVVISGTGLQSATSSCDRRGRHDASTYAAASPTAVDAPAGIACARRRTPSSLAMSRLAGRRSFRCPDPHPWPAAPTPRPLSITKLPDNRGAGKAQGCTRANSTAPKNFGLEIEV
jgi:DNA invertase Pin-like site-specific DNA recombinase